MTELAEQGVNAFKIRKVLSKIGDMKLVTIWMTAKRFGNRRVIEENIGNFIAPYFGQTEGNYHDPALRDPAGDRFDELMPTNRLLQDGLLQRGLCMGIM